jgi:alpha-methylacyl-CoA racemase
VFDGTDACVTPVLSMGEAPMHPQNVARDVFGGVDGHRLPNPAPRIGAVSSTELAPVRMPGADTADVLGRAGYSDGDIERLIAGGVVA